MSFNLAAWREWAGLSQRELAELAGVSFVAIAHVEQGYTRLRPGTLAALARAFGLPRSVLLHSTSEQEWEHGWRPPEPERMAV